MINLSSLVTISDPGNVGYQKLELWDSNGTVAGGQFVVNGVAQTGGHEIDVAPANVAGAVFDAGTAGGTDTLWAQLLLNDGTLTAGSVYGDGSDANVEVRSDTLRRRPGDQLSSLVTISDPGSVGYQKLELWDSNGTVAGASSWSTAWRRPGAMRSTSRRPMSPTRCLMPAPRAAPIRCGRGCCRTTAR